MSRDSWARYADRGSWYYEVKIPGYKCNMNDVQAALGISQLDKIGAMLERRVRIAERYCDRLQGSPWVKLPPVRPGNTHTWHLFAVRLHLESMTIGRDQFVRALTEENIGTSVHFIPIYRHAFFADYLPPSASFPACDDYFSRCISLPVYPGMSDDDVDDAADALVKVATYYRAD